MFNIRKIAIGLIAITFMWGLGTVAGFGGCGSTRGGSDDSSSSSGGGSSGTTETTTAAGTANVASLATVPSADLSTLDLSQTSSASALQTMARSALALTVAGKTKGVEEKKDFKENMNEVGGPSRAGCESNMHKKEIIRMSKQGQLPRCYGEALEKAGLITIPTGELALYSVTEPDVGDANEAGFCDDIPSERMEDKTACQEEVQKGPEEIKLRIGVISNALQMDVCFGGALEEEATYSADGAVYSATLVHIGSFQGKSEKGSFDMSVDLGTTGKVSNTIVTLGDGSATASANMDGGFGKGFMGFEATADYNIVRGAFAGDFIDPFTQGRTTFTGKAYAKFNATQGCAKFSFTGAPPPMRVKDMVPFDVTEDSLNGFLQAFSQQVCTGGTAITASNYQEKTVCPNPDFDSKAAGESDCPMIATDADGGCPTVTHSDIECFSISNGVTTNDFGGTEISQTFARIDETTARYYTDVNAFDLSTLDSSIRKPAFSRNWDCSGTFTAIDFAKIEPAVATRLETYMTVCFALEEGLNGEGGMGDYNCQGQEMSNGANELHEQGSPDNGRFGGDLVRQSTTCTTGQTPEHIFLNPVDLDNNQYCLPTERSCEAITIVNSGAVFCQSSSNMSITMPAAGHLAVTGLCFTAGPSGPATGAQITFGGTTASPQCSATYSLAQPDFEKPAEFGSSGSGTSGAGPPAACITEFGTDVTQEECEAFCAQPMNTQQCRGEILN